MVARNDACVASEAAPSSWNRLCGWFKNNSANITIAGLIGMAVGLVLAVVPVLAVAYTGVVLYYLGWFTSLFGVIGMISWSADAQKVVRC